MGNGGTGNGGIGDRSCFLPQPFELTLSNRVNAVALVWGLSMVGEI